MGGCERQQCLLSLSGKSFIISLQDLPHFLGRRDDSARAQGRRRRSSIPISGRSWSAFDTPVICYLPHISTLASEEFLAPSATVSCCLGDCGHHEGDRSTESIWWGMTWSLTFKLGQLLKSKEWGGRDPVGQNLSLCKQVSLVTSEWCHFVWAQDLSPAVAVCPAYLASRGPCLKVSYKAFKFDVYTGNTWQGLK